VTTFFFLHTDNPQQKTFLSCAACILQKFFLAGKMTHTCKGFKQKVD
jgi:hypothetical protein